MAIKRKYICAFCNAPATRKGEGLGTWHCSKGCPKRSFFVKRYTGSGAENTRSQIEDYPVRRAIAVRVVREEIQ